MQNNPNNQNPVASLVLENVPSEQGAMRSRICRIVNFVTPLVVVGFTTALTFGICAGVTRDPSQCVAPPVIAAMVATPVILILSHVNSSLRNWQSGMNPVPSASLVASANPTLVGIPVFSGSPSVSELNLASGVPSPRSSLDLERGGVSRQNTTNPINQSNANASLVFSV